MASSAERSRKLKKGYLSVHQTFLGPLGSCCVEAPESGSREMKKTVSPASYRLAPADMAQSPAVNVAQAYARYAAAMKAGAVPAPDFDHAVVRHALIDALERSHAEGRVIKLG